MFSVSVIMVFVTELLWGGWMLMAEAAHMLAFFSLWRFVKEKPQTLQAYMAAPTVVKHKLGL
jgi:hypothetical protein